MMKTMIDKLREDYKKMNEKMEAMYTALRKSKGVDDHLFTVGRILITPAI